MAAKPVDGCEMPVGFDLAEGWKPKPVKLDGGLLDDLAKQGDATLVCEIDAKPAGHIGFLRVWLTPATDAPQALKAFLAADQTGDVAAPTYREVKGGTEVVYKRAGDEGTGKRERALAMSTKDGTAVLVLSGFDNREFFAMLPAYVLARNSIRPTT